MSVAERAVAKALWVPSGILRLGLNVILGQRGLLATLVIVDLVATNLAFFFAYQLRYVYELGGEVPGENAVDFAAYVPVHALFVALCILGFQLRGNYSLPRASSITREAGAIIGSTAIAAMLVFALASMVRYPA